MTRAIKAKKLLALAALVLCLCMALSACSFPFDFDLPGLSQSGSGEADGDEAPRMRRTVPFGEMEYVRPDIDGLMASFDELTEKAAAATDIDTIMALDEEIGALQEEFVTMASLAFIKAHLDVNDAYFNEESRVLDEAAADLTLKLNNFNRALVEGPLAEEYRAEVGDHLFQSMQDDLLLSSDSVVDYQRQRSTLYLDYNEMYNGLTVDYNGTAYTLDGLFGVDSSALRWQLASQYFAQHIGAYVELYARMVELDKLTARELGFESAAHMYYLIHGRDYGPEEAQALCEEVKESFVPILYDIVGWSFDTGAMEMDKALAVMPEALDEVDPELRQAWDFMMDYDLYDFAATPGKSGTMQFTTQLYAWDAPYIFTTWRDDFYSAGTIIHEFGHFYDGWLRYDTATASGTDIAETYSQGLELLMHPTYPQLTDYALEAELDNLQDFFYSSILQQCLFEEFQLRLYALDSFDATIAGRLYADLLEEYGLQSSRDELGADNTWVTIGHFFYTPFYTISYANSAATALQIWAEGQEDWDRAADIYLKLIHADQNQSFTALVEGAGLKAPHKGGVIPEIAQLYSETFGTAVSGGLPNAG